MARPITIPNVFQNQTGNIPLSQLDTDFSTLATAINDPASYSNYAVDSGIVNAYIITLNPAPSTLASMVGVTITFKPLVTNTGASTINVNGFGAINILNPNGVALIAGEIVTGSMSTIIYDGTQYRLTGGLGAGVFTTVITPIISSATTLALQTNSGTTAVTIDASQNVGIGTASPSIKLDVVGAINSSFSLSANNTTASSNPLLISSGQTGTTVRSNSVARFQTTATGRDVFVQFSDAVSNATEIGMLSGATYFCTGATERMRIDSSGNVLVTSPAGLGYGIGSGGTVTQATSKSTGVTLNKPTGQITMNNAVLAANTAVQFQLTSALFTAIDSCVLSLMNGTGTTAAYILSSACGAGGVVITVRNASAVSLAEAIVINFAIIKGATA